MANTKSIKKESGTFVIHSHTGKFIAKKAPRARIAGKSGKPASSRQVRSISRASKSVPATKVSEYTAEEAEHLNALIQSSAKSVASKE